MSAVAASSELSVSVAYRRPKLVLDPWLCLDARGPSLIQKLQACAELWLVRELWHILDNSHYFAQEPKALLDDDGAVPSVTDYRALFGRAAQLANSPGDASCSARARALRRSLQFWDGLRLSSDLLGLKLFWLGDGLSESLLPEGSSPQLHPQHERLVEWLDGELKPRSPVQCAQRDALALALALGDVPILSTADRAGEVLSMARWLSASKLSCQQVSEPDLLLELERESWRSLLVRANCSSLVWSGLQLTLLHVNGSASFLPLGADEAAEGADLPSSEPPACEYPRVFWYAL
jgi:hypothetical protein